MTNLTVNVLLPTIAVAILGVIFVAFWLMLAPMRRDREQCRQERCAPGMTPVYLDYQGCVCAQPLPRTKP